MQKYKRMYLKLFNTVTDAIVLLERASEKEALQILKRAQQDAEEIYISAEELKFVEEISDLKRNRGG